MLAALLALAAGAALALGYATDSVALGFVAMALAAIALLLLASSSFRRAGDREPEAVEDTRSENQELAEPPRDRSVQNGRSPGPLDDAGLRPARP